MANRYNRQLAASYARLWANGRNPSWRNLSTTKCPSCGGDCTNFVSQALFAGGWTMDQRTFGGWFSFDEYPFTSRSWKNASDFAYYLRLSRRAEKCYRNEVTLGDIVQLSLNGNVIHTMIVTQDTGTMVSLSYHSTDTLDLPLPAVENKVSKSEDFIFWKVKDAIPAS